MNAPSRPPARERILNTAHELFYQHGIRATGVDRIIAECGVTKVTFYRHFPGKHALILFFLEYRHQRWLAWFREALERHGGDIHALVPAMAGWFGEAEFRGCAFINTVGELAEDLPEVVDIARRHKEAMTTILGELLPVTGNREELSGALAIAVDGAIVHAQYDASPGNALAALARTVNALVPPETP